MRVKPVSDRLLARYRLTCDAGSIESRAQALAIEQSVEMPAAAIHSSALRECVLGRVESIAAVPGTANTFDVDIALASTTTGHEPGQLMNMLFGNCSLQADVALLDVVFPDTLLAAMPGPAFGIDGLRAVCNTGHRALSCTALKPLGMSASELAALASRFARAGIDLIKDDHGIADQPSAPFEERVRTVQAAVDAANRETGGHCAYAPNLSGGPSRLAEQIRVAHEAGVRALLACPMLLGIPVFSELIRARAHVPILGHPALAGAARIAPPLLLGKLFRMFGADACIFPNYGGRFSYAQQTCLEIAAQARQPLGAIRACMPVPAGGMSVERVDEMLDQFGADSMLLIGGNLLEAGDALDARARAFADRVRDAGKSAAARPGR